MIIFRLRYAPQPASGNTSLPDVDSSRFAGCTSGARTVQSLWGFLGASWEPLGSLLGASWGGTETHIFFVHLYVNVCPKLGPQKGPRGPQEAPKRPQEAPKRLQEAPRGPQEAPKRLPEAPERAKSSKNQSFFQWFYF